MSMFNKNATPPTMNAVREYRGKVVEEVERALDPFEGLATPTDGRAEISCTVGRSLSYGEEKLSFTVTVRCDQNESALNEAGKRAFAKALEFCEDAIDLLGWKSRPKER